MRLSKFEKWDGVGPFNLELRSESDTNEVLLTRLFDFLSAGDVSVRLTELLDAAEYVETVAAKQGA